MGELDLSKAIEAADSAMEGVGIDDALFQKDRQQASRLAVRAALPHVLEALAEQAESERYEWAHAWLRGKADETRA